MMEATFDQLLGEARSRADQCPDEHDLAALVDRRASAGTAIIVEEHLRRCDECRATVRCVAGLRDSDSLWARIRALAVRVWGAEPWWVSGVVPTRPVTSQTGLMSRRTFLVVAPALGAAALVAILSRRSADGGTMDVAWSERPLDRVALGPRAPVKYGIPALGRPALDRDHWVVKWTRDRNATGYVVEVRVGVGDYRVIHTVEVGPEADSASFPRNTVRNGGAYQFGVFAKTRAD